MEVISDFDRTLTTFEVNGVKACSSHGILEMSRFMPSEYTKKTKELHRQYYPIEISQKIDKEEKTKKNGTVVE